MPHTPTPPPPSGLQLLSNDSHPSLAHALALALDTPLTPVHLSTFASGETSLLLPQSVRHGSVVHLATASAFPECSTNDSLVRACLLLSAARTASAPRQTLVCPSFPYARHDKKDRARAPIAARLVADLLVGAGAQAIITLDLHAPQIQAFFDVPLDNIDPARLIVRYLQTHLSDLSNAVIVSPDPGGAKRATALADKLGCDFALIQRDRHQPLRRASTTPALPLSSTPNSNRNSNSSSSVENTQLLVGHVRDKTAILIDDMIDTGQTVSIATHILRRAGATKVYAIATHAFLQSNPETLEMLQALPLDRLVVTNSMCQQQAKEKLGDKLDVICIAETLAEAVRRQHQGQSVSALSVMSPPALAVERMQPFTD